MVTINFDVRQDVDVIEEPGTGLPVAQCPYCSRGHSKYNAEMEEQEIPGTCRRCHAPMDWDAVHKPKGFADQQAEIAVKAPPHRRRDRMVRQASNKSQQASE